MPFAGFEDWSDCHSTMIKKGYTEEQANKICGKLKAKYEKDFDHTLIVSKYYELKKMHPTLSERELLEKVFSKITKDFKEDLKNKERDMDESELRDIMQKAEKYMVGMSDEEKETYLRLLLMRFFSKDVVKNTNDLEEDSNDFPKTYYCNICKSNHYFTSEIGKEHLTINKKQTNQTKKKEEKEIQEYMKKHNINHKTAEEDLAIMSLGKDFKPCKGHWVTIRGTHVCIQKGESKAQAIKRFIKSKEGEKSKSEKEASRKKFYEGLKGKKEPQKKKREVEKERKVPTSKKQEKELIKSEREKGVRKLIEQTGYERKRAEQEYEKEHPKKEPEKKELPKFAQYRIKRRREAIQNRVNKLQELNKKEPHPVLTKLLNLISIMMKEAMKEAKQRSLKPFYDYYQKIKKDKNIKEGRKRKIVSEISEFEKEIKELYSYHNDFSEEIKKEALDMILYNIAQEYEQMRYDLVENKKIRALRMGENSEEHRSADMVLEVLSWNLASNMRSKRQSWWNEMINKFPEIKKYVGETEEKDHPENAPQDLLIKIGNFIIKKEKIYDHIEIGYYKTIEGKTGPTVNLIMKGINVNPGPESLELAYESRCGAIIEGEIIGENTWGDGDVMINHKVLYEFDPQDPEEILEGMIRYGEDIFLGIWNLEDIKSWYNRQEEGTRLYDPYNSWDKNSPAMKLINEIEQEIRKEKQEEKEKKQKGKGRGWWEESERHSKARKTGKADLIEDAAVGRPRHRGLHKGTPGAKISGAKRTKVGQSITKALGKEVWEIAPTQSITVPFELTNTETGTIISGEVIENLEKNIKQLTPVSSSNMKAAGQFGQELLVQFYPGKNIPQRTYRYMMQSPEAAEEAYRSLISSSSPGRWVWRNIRGHIAGEKLTSARMGPSLSPPGTGIPTIGGTSASLIPYKISNRVPVTRVKKFDEIVKQMKRQTSNITKTPQTGSRVEGLLESRKELRELNVKGFRTGKGVLGLPRADFEYVGMLNNFTEDSLESCIEWYVKKQDVEEKEAEGICLGILSGKKKKKEKEEKEKEKEKKEKSYIEHALEGVIETVSWALLNNNPRYAIEEIRYIMQNMPSYELEIGKTLVQKYKKKLEDLREKVINKEVKKIKRNMREAESLFERRLYSSAKRNIETAHAILQLMQLPKEEEQKIDEELNIRETYNKIESRLRDTDRLKKRFIHTMGNLKSYLRHKHKEEAIHMYEMALSILQQGKNFFPPKTHAELSDEVSEYKKDGKLKIPRIKWEVKCMHSHYAQSKYIDPNELTRKDLSDGDRIQFSAHHPKTDKQIGYALFNIKPILDPHTKKEELGAYLAYLMIDNIYHFQGVSSKVLMPNALKFIDKNNLNVRGFASPLTDDTVLHKLVKFYEKFGGEVVKGEGGQEMFRKARPERWAKISDMKDMKIILEDLTKIFNIGNDFFYFDSKNKQYYQLKLKKNEK